MFFHGSSLQPSLTTPRFRILQKLHRICRPVKSRTLACMLSTRFSPRPSSCPKQPSHFREPPSPFGIRLLMHPLGSMETLDTTGWRFLSCVRWSARQLTYLGLLGLLGLLSRLSPAEPAELVEPGRERQCSHGLPLRSF
jgi:hypothetical protein